VDPVRFTVDIEETDFAQVKALAAERGVSRGKIVRDAIRAYVTRRAKG
jgi:metal-responsive CopG/Arc/MetJ family transcriptional regulator